MRHWLLPLLVVVLGGFLGVHEEDRPLDVPDEGHDRDDGRLVGGQARVVLVADLDLRSARDVEHAINRRGDTVPVFDDGLFGRCDAWVHGAMSPPTDPSIAPTSQ